MSFWSTIQSIPLLGDVVKVAKKAADDTTARLNKSTAKNLSANDKIKATIELAAAIEGHSTSVTSSASLIKEIEAAITKLQAGDSTAYDNLVSRIPKSAVASTTATNSVYTNPDSLLTQIAKAINLNVNLGADGKVTGSLSAGAAANPTASAISSITDAISKYWWILVIVAGAVLIFRRGRR